MDQDPASPLPPDASQTDDPSPPPPPSGEPERPAWLSGTPAETPPVAATPATAPAYTIPTIDPSPSSPTKTSGARKGIVGVAIALAVLIGAFALKVGFGFLVGSAAAGAFGAAFGGPWDRLPAETRDQLNQRAEAAISASTSGLSDAEKEAKVVELGRLGMARLDDQTLIRRITLYKLALDATDETTCASIFRSAMTGAIAEDDAKALIGAFSTEQFGEWAEIAVQAIEAEAKSAPAIRTVSDGDSSAMYEALFAAVTDDELATIQAMSVGTPVTDAEACQANRALYGAGLGLDDANLAAFALIDVAP